MRLFSDVSSIPEDVAQKQITALSESVRREVKEARGGTFYRKDGRALAMLNIWHPNVADWGPIHDLLAEWRVMPSSLIPLAVLIRDAADHIQQDIRGQLLPRLEHVRDPNRFRRVARIQRTASNHHAGSRRCPSTRERQRHRIMDVVGQGK